mgnify:CR=1 FL=1
MQVLADLAIELLHIVEVVAFLGHDVSGPIDVATDSKAAYDLCHRFTSSQHSRHIDRKMFKMRELRFAGKVKVELVPTKDNASDMLTKALDEYTFARHRDTIMNRKISES